jgi:hypothetical protein
MALTPLFMAAVLWTVSHAYIWPNPQLDALESIRYDQYGHNRQTIISGGLTPCTAKDRLSDIQGRSNAADWIRNVRSIAFWIHLDVLILDCFLIRPIMIWRRITSRMAPEAWTRPFASRRIAPRSFSYRSTWSKHSYLIHLQNIGESFSNTQPFALNLANRYVSSTFKTICSTVDA